MASPQADVLLTTPVLIPEEQSHASQLLRSQRLTASTKLLPDSTYPSRREALSRRQRGQRVNTIDFGSEQPKSFQSFSALYRQARNGAQQDKLGGVSALAKEAVEKAVAPAIQQGTSKLLQQSWINLIDSYGLTLIWINAHVFLRWTLGEQYFCKLGREWLSGGKTGGASAAKGAGQASNLILGLPAAGLGLLEAGTLAALDLIILMLILASLAIPAFLIYMIINPTEAVQLIGLSDLYDLVRAYLL